MALSLAYVMAHSIMQELQIKARQFANVCPTINCKCIARHTLQHFGLPSTGQVGHVMLKMMYVDDSEAFQRLFNELASDPVAFQSFNTYMLMVHDHLEGLQS